MSRRTQLVQQRKALQNAPTPIPLPKGPVGGKQMLSLGLEQLPGMLAAGGARPQIGCQAEDWSKRVAITASLGVLVIPLTLEPADARRFAEVLCAAADVVDPVPTSEAGEELLAEALAAAEERELGYAIAAEAVADSPAA